MTLYAARLASAIGDIGVVMSTLGLCHVVLGLGAGSAWLDELAVRHGGHIVADRERASVAMGQICEFLTGKRRRFDLSLDLIGYTAFQQAVWRGISAIPYGQVRSYGQVAEMIGRPGASRAVGQALNRNPVPIVVPCHRIVAADGTLGGFGAGKDREQGMRLKRALLAIEGHPLGTDPEVAMLPGLEPTD